SPLRSGPAVQSIHDPSQLGVRGRQCVELSHHAALRCPPLSKGVLLAKWNLSRLRRSSVHDNKRCAFLGWIRFHRNYYDDYYHGLYFQEDARDWFWPCLVHSRAAADVALSSS